MKIILGYPSGSDVDPKNLVVYDNIESAAYETDEYLIMEADSVEEAREQYEKKFQEWRDTMNKPII